MSSGMMEAHAAEQSHAAGQSYAAAQPDQLPPMTAETARRLAAALAPHWLAMRVVTAGTPYGACAGPGPAASASAAIDPAAIDPAPAGPAATDPVAANPAATAQLPPASAATTIFIAGMLERISASL